MIVDTSALMAIILNEPERDAFIRTLAGSATRSISAGSWVELGVVVIRKRNAELDAELERLLQDFRIVIEPVSIGQAEAGRQAYRSYGRGTGHPARLNLGDCFSYALAKESGEPLLFKGNDFSQTDIDPALR